uniref:Diaminopimelate epimerase n=1 Tax=Paulinella longichromatophora TaxID=1708747 RepID=A0A2H4ZNS0_9EUKA|nr:Diaminopimelate epimerase [Paulinella longichromatophora]
MRQFSKYQGLGNDFIIFDNRFSLEKSILNELDSRWITYICNRNFGVGANGIIFALPPLDQGDLRMRIFNADGKEAEMCGNGIRCLTRFLGDNDGYSSSYEWKIETLAGIIKSTLHENGTISIDMGEPSFLPNDVPTKLCVGRKKIPRGIVSEYEINWSITAVSIGNPHVIIVVEDIETINLDRWGSFFEEHFVFPKFSNVHFVEILSIDKIQMKTWERGVGITLACGTGACAVVTVTYTLGLTERQAEINVPGGTLFIHWQQSDNHLIMTGEAKSIFHGILTSDITPTSNNNLGNYSYHHHSNG